MPVPSIERLEEAISEALKVSKKRNFKQSVELIVVMRDINVKQPSGRIREIVFLPHPPRKEVKVCVVADGDMALKARESGAYKVITREDLEALVGNRKAAKKIAQECDWVLVKTSLMALAGRTLGPALGPRGKIPVPVPPSMDVEAAIKRYKAAVMIRTKDQPQVMCRIGTEDMSSRELAENAYAVISSLVNRLPNPEYNIFKVYVKTTMGPAVEVRMK